MWFKLARKVAKWHGVHFHRLLWALRQEPGEIGGRLHFHALIGGLPSYAVSVPTCFSIMAAWERLGGGLARCREFDRTRNGPDTDQGRTLLRTLESGFSGQSLAQPVTTGTDEGIEESPANIGQSHRVALTVTTGHKTRMVLGGGLEPPRLSAHAPQTCVSAISPPEQEEKAEKIYHRRSTCKQITNHNPRNSRCAAPRRAPAR